MIPSKSWQPKAAVVNQGRLYDPPEPPQNTPLNLIKEGLKNEIADQIDAQLLKFFGSIEDMRRYGHLYVLETEPVRMELMTHSDLDFNSKTFMCQAITKTKIRPKTREELEADQHD